MNRLDTVIGNCDQFKCEGTKLLSIRSEKNPKKLNNPYLSNQKELMDIIWQIFIKHVR